MTRITAALVGLVLGLSGASAQVLPMNVRMAGQYTALGYCQLTSLAVATGLATCSGGIPVGSTFVEICNGAVALAYRDDGTAPTAGVGMPIAAGVCFQYAGFPLSAISVIQTAANGVLNVSFYK